MRAGGIGDEDERDKVVRVPGEGVSAKVEESL
jgi:hypothetical protein